MIYLALSVALAVRSRTALACTPDSAMTYAAANAYSPGIEPADFDSALVKWIGPVTGDGERLLALVGNDDTRPVFVVVGCDARIHGLKESGQVDSAAIVRAIPGRFAAVVSYRSGYGTGWVQHSTAVLVFEGDSIAVSFDGETSEVAADRAADGSFQDSAVVTLAAPGTVTRAGVRYRLRCSGSGDCIRTAPTPFRERYVWDAASRTFLKAAGPPPRH